MLLGDSSMYAAAGIVQHLLQQQLSTTMYSVGCTHSTPDTSWSHESISVQLSFAA